DPLLRRHASRETRPHIGTRPRSTRRVRRQPPRALPGTRCDRGVGRRATAQKGPGAPSSLRTRRARTGTTRRVRPGGPRRTHSTGTSLPRAMTALLVPFARWLGAQLRGRIEYLGGLAVAGAGLVVWNVAVYGYALGFHAKHVVEGADLASRVREIAWVIPRLLYLAVRHGPVVVVACSAAVLVLALGLGNESMRGQIRLWAALGVAFVL